MCAMRVAVPAIEAIVAHAREAAPDECCGLLVGGPGEIVEALRARNVAADPSSRFVVDPKDHIDRRREARGRGLDVVGFYHSHPRSPAAPSERDRSEAGYPGHLYAIVSLAAGPPDLALFRLELGNFHPVSFVTVR
jgi:proteasome lid subunit RPN8/RPN11